jgi:hypothetical protein
MPSKVGSVLAWMTGRSCWLRNSTNENYDSEQFPLALVSSLTIRFEV